MRYLRQYGWDAFQADSASELRRLARCLEPTVVVLDTAAAEESGWLTCAKLRLEYPALKIVLVTGNPVPRKRRFARFVGASELVDRGGGVTQLVDAVFGAALRAVG
jgi:DNA-binding response OmpR family regulator